MAKGYTQMEIINYFYTFSLVAKLTIIRVLLLITAIKGWHLEQRDVNNAFIHGELNEKVHMTHPPGLFTSKSSQVCKLQKSLRYSQSQVNNSLYVKSSKNSFTTLLVYIDDIVLVEDSIQENPVCQTSFGSKVHN